MRLIMAFASGLYSGYLPKAPGTWGSIAGLLLFMTIRHQTPPVYGAVIIALLLLGIPAAGEAEKILDQADPGIVVIDEIVGMLITLFAAPDKPWFWLTGFVIFRIFDIFKPFPIRLIDQRLNGGYGIMLDDVMAGIYSLAVLQLIRLMIQ